jgi:hypothetical protein
MRRHEGIDVVRPQEHEGGAVILDQLMEQVVHGVRADAEAGGEDASLAS